MEPWINTAVAIVTSIIASSGFWVYLHKRTEKNDSTTQMLIGLGHDRIIYLGLKYVERGIITQDEYENLYQYLYLPYKKLGGNGSADRIMHEVEKIPIVKGYIRKEDV